ncbi:MAG TPA: flavin reductase family protein [Woeseiaceae bacterium]|nr:flavin reductase family protein [Woeseiaceae bacterium]
MSIDSSEFRRALGCFPTGVAVVTTANEHGVQAGITISSFSSVSLDPPLVLWSIARDAVSYEQYMNARYFAVHVLSARDKHISDRFSQRGGDKFRGLDCRPGIGNVPILPEFSACFECETEHRYDGGDHKIIVGRVLRLEVHDKAPLIFHRGQFLENGDKT